MATIRYRVIYHSEIGGKLDTHFGHRQALVAAADSLDTLGFSLPVPSNIATVLSNNSLHNPKSGAVTVLDSVANLDEKAVAVYS